jgi:hypothetical protein
LDTLLFQGLLGRAVFEDEPGMGDGTTEGGGVSRGNSHRAINFLKEPGEIFFPPSVPPHGGRKKAVVLIVVKR